MTRVGVCLSGCGVFDGAEIHESVISLLALNRAGAEVTCFAPDVAQMHVVNHRTGEVSEGETRNVLDESARIARGEIRSADEVSAADFDALLIPGGFGAAKNLCSFAVDGAEASVNPEVARIVQETVAAGKPLAAICIAPATIAAALRGGSVTAELTIGNDQGAASGIEAMGGTHIDCPVDSFHVDRQNKIVTTPAYMLAGSIAEAADGIEKTVAALLELT